jgi:streptogramin lyase
MKNKHASYPYFFLRLLPPLFFACLFFPLFSQPNPHSIQFERIGSRQGLPSDIKFIHQDKLGFLWIASSSGLFRYDGHRFKVYKNSPGDPNGLSSNFVVMLCESRSGSLWAIAEDGWLHLYDAATDRFRRFKLHFENGDNDVYIHVQCLVEDQQGVLWVGSAKSGLCRLDQSTGKLTRQPLQPGRTDENVNAILEDAKGNLWVTGEGLFCLKPSGGKGGSRELTQVTGFESAHLFVRLIDKSGAVWLGGKSPEVVRFEPLAGKTRRYFYQEKSGEVPFDSNCHVTAIHEDRHGIIWVVTNPSGISLLDPVSGGVASLKYDRNDPQSLGSNAVTHIFESRSGIVWVGTWGGGLSKHDPATRHFGHQRHFPADPKTLGNPNASTFCETPDGAVWVGSNIGVSKFKRQEGAFERFFINRQDLSILSIQAIGAGLPGTLWVGTTRGLMLFDAASGRFSDWHSPNPEDDALENTMVYFLENDAAGDLWVVSYPPFKLFRFDAAAGFFQKIDFMPEADEGGDVAVVADWQNHIWAGTLNRRFYKFDRNARRHQRQGRHRKSPRTRARHHHQRRDDARKRRLRGLRNAEKGRTHQPHPHHPADGKSHRRRPPDRAAPGSGCLPDEALQQGGTVRAAEKTGGTAAAVAGAVRGQEK